LPDQRRHRGPHPEDERLFGPEAVPLLRGAVGDLSWLLQRGYAPGSALKLVGDRYRLDERQRNGVMRCSAADDAVAHRQRRRLAALAGRVVALDGYNVLTTVEAGLSGGVILRGRDGCYRDLARMARTWHRVDETASAFRRLSQAMLELDVSEARWYFDSPISNSGRLAALLRAEAVQGGWPCTIELVPNPDAVLMRADGPVVSADSEILDRCQHWFNLTEHVLRELDVWLVDLG
jgi:hypothetical protein